MGSLNIGKSKGSTSNALYSSRSSLSVSDKCTSKGDGTVEDNFTTPNIALLEVSLTRDVDLLSCGLLCNGGIASGRGAHWALRF